VKVFGEHDENTLAQLEDVASRAEKAALMADGHLGYVMPIGGVAAYDRQVSVVGVGFDIACGNAAILTDLTVDDIVGHTDTLADSIFASLSFGVGLTNRDENAPQDHELFQDPAWDAIPEGGHAYRRKLREKARQQLGTIGAGNHYVDVFADEQNRIWVGVHFGSRGFGHTVASNFLALSAGQPWGTKGKEREILLHLDDPIGHDYWHLMELAGRYAYAGREWVCRKVVSLLGGREVDLVHNHHNFAWLENHDGRDYVVIRKGATPAHPGQRGFVGGSMGDNAVILKGANAEEGSSDAWLQKEAMFSTVHGAGRVMSRTKAKGRWKKGKLVKPGCVTHQEMHGWVKERGVVLRGGDLDESPQAYRRLPEVLKAQGGTVEVLHTLRPMIVCMAPDQPLGSNASTSRVTQKGPG
jgi:tRNA-splicing ligase RtcB